MTNISKKEFSIRMAFAKMKIGSRMPDLDKELVNKFAEILMPFMYEPHLGCATTGELIEELKARSDLEYKTIDRK